MGSGPFGIALDDIEVSNLFIPSLGGANAVGRLFAIGTYGAQGQEQFSAESPLDRWFFCVSRTRFRLPSLCPLCLSVCGVEASSLATRAHRTTNGGGKKGTLYRRFRPEAPPRPSQTFASATGRYGLP